MTLPDILLYSRRCSSWAICAKKIDAMAKRPDIPAELRRKVLIEAGHRCAIPTCRHMDVEVHHIIPWEKCQKHEYENLIALCPNCHRRAGKKEIDVKSLRIYKGKLRTAHDTFSRFEVDFLFELYNSTNHELQFPSFLWLLVKRLIDSAYCERIQSSKGLHMIKVALLNLT